MFRALTDYVNAIIHSEAYRPERILPEMLLIGLVIYSVLRFLRGTRGARILQGIFILVAGGYLVVNVLAQQFGLERLRVLYQPFVWMVLLTTLIVFQPELRRGLMRLGETRWRRVRQSEIDRVARPVALACTQLAKNKIGALIAIERDIGLTGIVDQGVHLDARVSADLLNTIFWPGSALHDMGVVIQRGRIAAAGCQFPIEEAEGIDRQLGSRHRAGVTLSLDSDAIVIIVSEETGTISIAERGRLHRHIAPDTLFDTLRRRLGSPRGLRRREEPAGRSSPATPPPPATPNGNAGPATEAPS